MKKFFVVTIFLLSIFDSFAQLSDSVIVVRDVQYCTSKNIWKDSSVKLFCDIYFPNSDIDTLRPLVITLFGGGFVVGDKSSADMELFCSTFAKDGYVSAAINYRLLPPTKFSGDNLVVSGFIAASDLCSAIKFFKANSQKYGIDTNKIMLVGQSAGAVTILHELFLDKNEYPEPVKMFPELEDLHKSYDDSLNCHTYNVLCAVSLWGCVMDLSILDNYESETPLCLIHGTKDVILPHTNGYSFSLKNLPFVYGSVPIAEKLRLNNYPVELHLFEGEEHAFYYDILYMYKINQPKFSKCYTIIKDFMDDNLEKVSD